MKLDKIGKIVLASAVTLAVMSTVVAQFQFREPNQGSYLVGPSLVTASLACLLAPIGSIILVYMVEEFFVWQLSLLEQLLLCFVS